jgi:hypothetical protein
MEQCPGSLENPPTDRVERLPIQREDVVEMLKKYGREDNAAQELLDKWSDDMITDREKQNGVDAKEYFYDTSMDLAIEIALIYRDAGFVQEAIQDLEINKEIAYQTYNEDALLKIERLLDEINKV